MKINNGEIDCTPDNTYIVSYPNDLLDGVLIDLDDNYAFISAHTPGYSELLDELDTEGIESFQMDEDTDMSVQPHCWVMKSVGRLIVAEAEAALEQSE